MPVLHYAFYSDLRGNKVNHLLNLIFLTVTDDFILEYCSLHKLAPF